MATSNPGHLFRASSQPNVSDIFEQQLSAFRTSASTNTVFRNGPTHKKGFGTPTYDTSIHHTERLYGAVSKPIGFGLHEQQPSAAGSPESTKSKTFRELECLRTEYKNAQLMLKNAVKKNSEIEKELNAYKIDVCALKADNEKLLQEKLELEAKLKALRVDTGECERTYRYSISSDESSIAVISIDNEEDESRPIQSISKDEMCFCCKETLDDESISVHKQCLEKLIQCPDSSKFILLGGQEYQEKRAEAHEDYGFVANVNRLLEERKGIDVTFVIETLDFETEIFAHQLIVAARSSFFENEFYGKGKNKEHKTIPLKEVNLKAFESMIRYCYDDKPRWNTIEEACSLFKVASMFKVVNLVNICSTFLNNSKIEPGNVFFILEVAEQMENKCLRDKCFKVMQVKTKEVMAAYELHNVTPSMVYIILDLQQLSLESEYELINWIFEWGKVKYKEKDSGCENDRDYLEKLLQDMNFLSLTVEEFAMLCKDNMGFFTPDEEASIYSNIILPGMRKMPDFYDKDLKPRKYSRTKE